MRVADKVGTNQSQTGNTAPTVTNSISHVQITVVVYGRKTKWAKQHYGSSENKSSRKWWSIQKRDSSQPNWKCDQILNTPVLDATECELKAERLSRYGLLKGAAAGDLLASSRKNCCYSAFSIPISVSGCPLYGRHNEEGAEFRQKIR